MPQTEVAQASGAAGREARAWPDRAAARPIEHGHEILEAPRLVLPEPVAMRDLCAGRGLDPRVICSKH